MTDDAPQSPPSPAQSDPPAVSLPAQSDPPVVSPPPEPASLPVAPPPVLGDADDPPTTASGPPNPHGLPELVVQRPEVAVGAAFAGGLLVAMILRRLAR